MSIIYVMWMQADKEANKLALLSKVEPSETSTHRWKTMPTESNAALYDHGSENLGLCVRVQAGAQSL